MNVGCSPPLGPSLLQEGWTSTLPHPRLSQADPFQPSPPPAVLVSPGQALRHLQSSLRGGRKPWSATASKPVARMDGASHGTCEDSTWKRAFSSCCRNNVPFDW